MRVDSVGGDLESLEVFLVQYINRTALVDNTMKFAMMMETTIRSSWLAGLMPLKSLFVKVMGGRLHYSGASTKLMLMSRMTCRKRFWDWLDCPP